mmetsp:Transcript_27297/g.64133  ORF Transcript_27297/g.64133 Transcript_27297/m.64133 type:complete len:257 (+) Transcript_27297:117-887(+)
MLQAKDGYSANILLRHLVPSLQGREGASRPIRDDVATQAVNVQLRTNLGDFDGQRSGHLHLGQSLSGFQNQRLESVVLRCPNSFELLWCLGPFERPGQHLFPPLGTQSRADGTGQAEAIQELGPQISFIWVRSAHEDKSGGVAHTHTLSFHCVDAARGTVQQHIDELVVKEVALVYVEDAAVHAREDAGLECLARFFQGPLDINRASDAILCGAQRQLNKGSPPHLGLDLLARIQASQHLLTHQSYIRGVRVVDIP